MAVPNRRLLILGGHWTTTPYRLSSGAEPVVPRPPRPVGQSRTLDMPAVGHKLQYRTSRSGDLRPMVSAAWPDGSALSVWPVGVWRVQQSALPGVVRRAGGVAIGPKRAKTPTVVNVRTPAKINLTLAVLDRRPDGYHEIESLVTPVGLYDDLSLRDLGDGQIRLVCDGLAVPTGPENLVYRAAERLADRTPSRPGVEIRLTKRIPIGAGLGGGSSDAAATLVGLNRLWDLGLDRSTLAAVAADLGSDVPLFLDGGSVVIRGRGERVEPVELGWSGWVVLVVPPFGMSTAAVYERWEPVGSPPRSADEVVRAGSSGKGLDELLFNMLERPAFALEPRLAGLHAGMIAMGAPRVRMSGSGATLFALFDEAGPAESFAAEVTQRLGVDAHMVRTTTCEHL